MIETDLTQEIERQEALARQLEPSKTTIGNWDQAVQKYANQFIDSLDKEDQTYTIDGEADVSLMEIQEEVHPMSIEELLPYIAKEVDGPGINPAAGGHMGYIPGGGVIPTALGDYLAAITNRYAGVFYGSPGAVRMEHELIRWMCRLMNYPDTALGNLTSGGSIANLIAVATARDAKGLKARDYERNTIYLTPQIHHSIQKAIRIAGLNELPIRYVPTDDRFRMDSDALAQQLAEDVAKGFQPFMIVASAGTTDVGAIDPLIELAKLAQEFDAWFHVDAAYGGFFQLTDTINYDGIEQADSITIDPHKGLFLAYGSGAVLIKNVEAMAKTHHYQANYMQDANTPGVELSPADLSPELTKHFRGLRMWLPIRLFGLSPFKAALEEKLLLTKYFYEKVQGLGFEVGPEPELSVAIYRFVPDKGDANAFNASIIDYVKKDGRIFLSSTSLEGVYWLRIAILCFRTHKYHVDLCLEILENAVSKLMAR